MYKSIAMGSQYVSHWLRVVVCVSLVCPHIFFKFGATNFFYTSYVIEMKPDKFVARESSLGCIVTYLRKNYPGSSIGRSPNLQAGIVVLITAMDK